MIEFVVVIGVLLGIVLVLAVAHFTLKKEVIRDIRRLQRKIWDLEQKNVNLDDICNVYNSHIPCTKGNGTNTQGEGKSFNSDN